MKQKIFFFTIILIILNSCAVKRSYKENKETTKIDSVFITKERIVVDRVVDSVFIDSPCDSLGNLKPFKYALKTKQGNISLSNLNNSIVGNIDLNGYESSIETKYKLMYEKKVSEINKTKVTNIIPLWSWIYMISATLVIFLLIRFR